MICVLSKDANVVRYLTHDYAPLVRVTEFYRRPFNPRQLPLAEFQPQVLLVERAARFLNFRALFPADRHAGAHPAFDEIRLDHAN